MKKEVVINLSEPTYRLAILVDYLIQFLGSEPVTTEVENQLTFHLPVDMVDDRIVAIIQPCIGAFVKSVDISEI